MQSARGTIARVARCRRERIRRRTLSRRIPVALPLRASMGLGGTIGRCRDGTCDDSGGDPGTVCGDDEVLSVSPSRCIPREGLPPVPGETRVASTPRPARPSPSRCDRCTQPKWCGQGWGWGTPTVREAMRTQLPASSAWAPKLPSGRAGFVPVAHCPTPWHPCSGYPPWSSVTHCAASLWEATAC